jgi:hypothetical protein
VGRDTLVAHFKENNMHLLQKWLAVLGTILALTAPARGAELIGSVSYADGLYTYSYELIPSGFEITEVLVLVNSEVGNFDLMPVSGTSPPGWGRATYVGVDFNGQSDSVTYFGWGGAGTLTALSGFSFTTSAAPAAQPAAITYALFAPTYTGGPAVAPGFYVGSVVAPDLRAVVPEPQVYGMLFAGLALILLARKRALWKAGRSSLRGGPAGRRYQY